MWSDLEAVAIEGRTMFFDSECRPLSYLSGDYTTGEVTAIAWSFDDEEQVHCELLSQAIGSLDSMLQKFAKAWDATDLAVGHYIKGHDLPVINGALMEQGLDPLSPKLVQDSKSDLLVSRYISLSQESLAAMLGLDQPKLHMTQADWRSANRLEPDGLKKTHDRVVADVEQNRAMYEKLKERGWLGVPKLWDPSQAKSFRYKP